VKRAFAAGAGLCLSCAAATAMARVELRCPENAAELAVDGAPSGKPQGKTRLTLKPGHHVFAVRSDDGTTQVREADLGPGDWIALDLGGTK
jgi:hypothetical protein